MKISKIIHLIPKFIRTEIATSIELLVWLSIKNTDFYLILWQTDYMKPAIVLALASIPLIVALNEYKSNKKEIDALLREINTSPH